MKSTSVRLRVNPIACQAHGICAEVLPERITLDDWGYPIIDERPIAPELLDHAKRAAGACPTLALLLEPTRIDAASALLLEPTRIDAASAPLLEPTRIDAASAPLLEPTRTDAGSALRHEPRRTDPASSSSSWRRRGSRS